MPLACSRRLHTIVRQKRLWNAGGRNGYRKISACGNPGKNHHLLRKTSYEPSRNRNLSQ
jgi:hypothetical protein